MLKREEAEDDVAPPPIFAYLLDAQPAPVRDAFHYCLCLLMVQAGKMRLVEKIPGENGTVCVRDHGPRPVQRCRPSAALIDVSREIL